MKKSIVVIIISSLFVIQCYTQYQYTPKAYEYDSTDVLVRLELEDTIHNFPDDDTSNFKIENDSLIIKYEMSIIDSLVTKVDTVSMSSVKNLTVSNFNTAASVAVMIGYTLVLVVIAVGLDSYGKQ